MRNSIIAILLGIMMLSCTSKDCTLYEGLNWCYEVPSEVVISDNSVLFSNKKDGLFFSAEVSRDCESTVRDIESFEQEFIVTKEGGPSFTVRYNEVVTRLALNDTHIVQGLAIAETNEGPLCVTWTGVNKKKALRLIKLLLK